MREAKIILPASIEPAPAWNELFRDFEGELIQTFGGFTRNFASGAWNDAQGRTVREPVRIYIIAAELDCIFRGEQWSSNGALRLLAVKYGRRLAQDTVYFRDSNGEVEIIDCARPRFQNHPNLVGG